MVFISNLPVLLKTTYLADNHERYHYPLLNQSNQLAQRPQIAKSDISNLYDCELKQAESYDLLHHEPVRSVDALACCDLHGLLCNFFASHLGVGDQGPCGALGIESATANADRVLDFKHVSGAIELDDEFLVDDDECGLEVAHLLAGAPLLRVGDAAFEGLLGVLRHHLFQSLDQVEGVGQRPSEPAVHPVAHLPDLPRVDLHLRAAQRHLPVSDDHCLARPLQGQDGRVVPLLSAEPPFQNLGKHLNYYISMIIPINRSLGQKSRVSEEGEEVREIINGHGIHDTAQVILVGLLIIVSVTVVFTTNEEIRQHDRYLRTYFNLNLLGKDDLGLYEEGLNIDESEMEFATLGEIRQHFAKILNVSNSIEEDGLVAFTPSNQSIIKFEMQAQGSEFNVTYFETVEQAMDFFHHLETGFFRDLLLSSDQIRLTFQLGENKFVKDYELIGEYKMYSEMMVRAKLDVRYQLKSQKQVKLNGLRILQQVIAAILFLIYLYQLILLSHKSQKHRIFARSFKDMHSLKAKYRNWYFFLQLMCLVTLFSQKYAPICAFFQILPIFEFPDKEEEKENSELYNFNKNLRFSFPLIMTIFFQILIFLNGFIFYSMLMYPGEYFDDYLKGFFSYVYQLFQVGTYEIFTELQSYGNFAYMLYALLYFYVFEVGNSLIPALFVIMIEMKVTEKFLKRHVTELVSDCTCPHCHEKNSHEAGSTNMHIVVKNPKLSPLLNRKKYASQQQSRSEQDQPEALMMLYIEEEENDSSPEQQGKQFHLNYKFANYSKKILHTVRKLQKQSTKYKDQPWLLDCLRKVQAALQNFD